jgi:hypothetical protein
LDGIRQKHSAAVRAANLLFVPATILRVLEDVRQNWYRLIPECAEMMKGEVGIELAGYGQAGS